MRILIGGTSKNKFSKMSGRRTTGRRPSREKEKDSAYQRWQQLLTAAVARDDKLKHELSQEGRFGQSVKKRDKARLLLLNSAAE